jgi:thioesterase domain-containing protein
MALVEELLAVPGTAQDKRPKSFGARSQWRLMSMSTSEAHAVVWTEILAVAKHLGKREWRPVKHPSVIQLKEGAAETPVYFIGAGFSECHLAQLIRSKRSIFGVDIPFASAWRNAVAKQQVYALPTMEQLVAPYVAALSAHARFSPCMLVGHSFNGLMAFEAAHQLNQRGRKVEMVLLLDTQLEDISPHHVAWQKLKKDWQQPFNLHLTDRTLLSIASRLGSSWSTIRWMLVKEMKELGHRFLEVALRHPGVLTTTFDENGLPWHWGLLSRLYSHAQRSYQARCLDCRGVLFRADPESPEDRSLSWDNLFSKGLEIIQVTGSHNTLMQSPHIATLAREMNKVLDRSLVGPSRK